VYRYNREEGIEVLHLYSGRTLCKMLLPPPGLHADVNGDGVVDHVQAHGGGLYNRPLHKPQPSCSISCHHLSNHVNTSTEPQAKR
jgi:hypothetical protein